MRRMDTCVDCADGEYREIVSGQKDGHPRCRKHDMELRRKQEEVGVLASLAARGNRLYMKERNEDFKHLCQMVILLRKIKVWKGEEAATIKAILHKHLSREVETLRPRTLEVVNGSPQPVKVSGC